MPVGSKHLAPAGPSLSRYSRRVLSPTESHDSPNPRHSHRHDHSDVPTLTLRHPILQILDSCAAASRGFDQVHAQLTVTGLLLHPLAAGRAIRKLCDAGSINRVLALFDRLDDPDAFICNAIIRSFLASGDRRGALDFYRHRVRGRYVLPNRYTFPLLAKLFSELGAVAKGETTHAGATKSGFESDLFVRNSLIHMYSSFGNVASASKLFGLGARSCEFDLVTWNSMVNGYVKNGMVDRARELFDQMPQRDSISWNVMIAGHAGAGDMEGAERLFSAMPQSDIVSWNGMLSGYASLGEVVPARILFDRMPAPNLVSWNTMLALYVRKKDFAECLLLFDRMVSGATGVAPLVPNEATLVSVLTACAHLDQLEKGRWVHSYMREAQGRVQPDVLLHTALLNMYAKCGDVDSAREVFDHMPERSVVSWNSMIMAYGMHGLGHKALEMFLEMEKSGVRPNEATLVCALSACAHAGMVLEGWWCFDRMVHAHCIRPNIEHYGCMVDLFSRAGLLRDSKELVNKIESLQGKDDAPALLGSLLSACTSQSNLELGEIVGKRLIEVEPDDVGAYVMLSNAYAAQGRWDDVEKVRNMIKEKGLLKSTGVSLVGSSECNCYVVDREGSSLEDKKLVLYSMLSEMGDQMKVSCKEI